MVSEEEERWGLRVGPSSIPNAGLGLYTTRKRHAHEFICNYNGELLTAEQMNQRYSADELAEFAVQISKNKFLDARDKRSAASFMNDALNSGFINNVKFVATKKNAAVFSIVDIPADSELFISYGTEYWQSPLSDEPVSGCEFLPCRGAVRK